MKYQSYKRVKIPHLEVCCSDLGSILEAVKGGAERIELCSSIDCGGLTPSPGMIRFAKQTGLATVNVLIRSRGGDFRYSDDELNIMAADAEMAIEAGADGIVVGALDSNNEIFSPFFEELRGITRTAASRLGRRIEIVCSRAIDCTPDILSSTEQLCSLGIDRILTSGGRHSAPAGYNEIRRIVEIAHGRIKVMAGGGINPDNVARLIELTGVDAIHSTCHDPNSPTTPPPSDKSDPSTQSDQSDRSDSSPLPSKSAPKSQSEAAKDFGPAPSPYSSARIVREMLTKISLSIFLILSFAIPGLSSDFRDRMIHLGQQKIIDEIDSIDCDILRNDLKLLYAYMPAADIVGYPPQFFIREISTTRRALKESDRHDSIPEEIIRNYLIPLRVNNEELDDFRSRLYPELKKRIAGMTSKDAILEINHWAHEKVTYQPSDERTSSPLATISRSKGRCGEESTLLVAALRTVGIPARQVYTPRWAHTDSNHAWVEAFADGKWWYLGACEPAPRLNMAWFSIPATRGMLMTTTISSPPPTNELLITSTPLTAEINVTPSYTPTAPMRVRLTDAEGTPLNNHNVTFGIYNWAEFYPLAVIPTDDEGFCELLTGMGDLMVSADNSTHFGYEKARAGELTDLKLKYPHNFTGELQFTLHPPRELPYKNPATADEISFNNRRLDEENSIRRSYEATFFGGENFVSKYIPQFNRLSQQFPELIPILHRSKGNHDEILKFISSITSDPYLTEPGLHLLSLLNDKDISEVKGDILMENLVYAYPVLSSHQKIDNFNNIDLNGERDDYILSPRIGNEPLRAWRKIITETTGPENLKKFKENPNLVIDWIKNNILIDNGEGSRDMIITPDASMRSKLTDIYSKDILAIALLRTAGVASRLNPIDLLPEYYDKISGWLQLGWSHELSSTSELNNGNLQIINKLPLRIVFIPDKIISSPKYYSSYSLSKFRNGKPELMDLGNFATIDEINSKDDKIDEGNYLIISGRRLADGSVKCLMNFQTIDSSNPSLILKLPEDSESLQVIGNFDCENLYSDPFENKQKSILSTVGRDYYALLLLHEGDEPSEHIITDLIESREDLSAENPLRDRKILLLYDAPISQSITTKERLSQLPENVIIGILNQSAIESIKELSGDSPLPVAIVADSFNRVIFTQGGYSIGVPKKIIEIFSKINTQNFGDSEKM